MDKLEKPKFKSTIPEHLLNGLSQAEKFLYEQQSVQTQKLDWIVDRTIDADTKRQELEVSIKTCQESVSAVGTRVAFFEELWGRIKHRKALIAGFFTILAIPAFIAWFTAYCEHKLNK
jgi:hypothetical protein